MRPSMSVSLEPGLERGVPWGRDLYTFVTSAAGHMMRTLQKPRKNRPSKRQVNHRRFLHNMIQRKFADIEAANHRLASALNLKEEETNRSLPSQKPETPNLSGIPSEDGRQDMCSRHPGADDINESSGAVSGGSHQTEISEKKQQEAGLLWKRHTKSHPTTCTAKSNQSKGRQSKESRNLKLLDFTSMSSPKGIDFYNRSDLVNTECDEYESQPLVANSCQEDSQKIQQDSNFIQFGQDVDISPSYSPELSPLSLDSCDFSMQLLKDALTQKNASDISASQWTDFIDIFSVGSKDLGGCMDVEAYLESICACQGDDGKEDGADGFGLSDQSDSLTPRICTNRSEVEDLNAETGDYRYECGYIYHGDQGLTLNHSQNEDIAETQFHNNNPSQGTFIIHNQLSTSICNDYNSLEQQVYHHPHEESPCMIVSCENRQNFASFEGVAQSFSVSLHNPEHHPIQSPPHEDDWLFADILKDRESADGWKV